MGRGVDLETAIAVKDLALRMGNAIAYKEGGAACEDYSNHIKLTDVDQVTGVYLICQCPLRQNLRTHGKLEVFYVFCRLGIWWCSVRDL